MWRQADPEGDSACLWKGGRGLREQHRENGQAWPLLTCRLLLPSTYSTLCVSSSRGFSLFKKQLCFTALKQSKRLGCFDQKANKGLSMLSLPPVLK